MPVSSRFSYNLERTMPVKKPSGKDLLALLIKLLADQEGVKITYETWKTANGQTVSVDAETAIEC